MVSPQYQFKVSAGLNNAAGLTNVELLTDGERYFYAPVLIADYILRQPTAGGLEANRGYQSFTWQSDVWRGQYQHLYGTLLVGTLQNNVTFQTQRVIDNGAYSIWQGKLTLPDMSAFQRNYRQYQNMPWNFSRCVQIG